MLFALLLSCAEPDEPTPPPPTLAEQLAPLPAPRLLRRVALDLVGELPDVADLDAVEADPAALDAIVDRYLEDPRFEDRYVALLAERWQTVMDTYEVSAGDYALPPDQGDLFAHSVGEEPLRLVARVVAEDRPYTDIVTADWTMANDLLATIWPLERPDEGEGWTPAYYTDGRPAAGVLGTNGFYWRYVTNVSNKNRGRAAAVARLLLCTDILARPVTFARSDTLDAEEAIRTVPACVSCHATVDPIAAHFFGYWWTIQYNPFEMQTYHPERELLAEEMLGVAPAWYGTPTGGLVDLGEHIANDPRFARCGAQSFAEDLWQRPVDLVDYETVEALRAGFEDTGLSPRALLRAVIATPQYRAGGVTGLADDDTLARERTERLLVPDQQASAVEALTGYRWTRGGWDMLANDTYGYRVLGGGVDGYSVTATQDSPGLTWVLVNERLAQAGAHAAVTRDLEDGVGALLTVDRETRPGEAAFDAQLHALHWRLYAERADAAWITDISALWSAVDATDGPSIAWEGVLEAMLRDPRFVSY